LTLTDSDFQAQFKSQITATPEGESARNCFECGTCTGVCPVSESGSGFDPRKILHMIKMGLKDRLLGSEVIWHCTHCDTCGFVCPQNVRFSTVVDILRDIAVAEGYVDGKDIEKWGTAPCKAACPAHISIPGFLKAVAGGRYQEGLKLIKEQMPFPGICGRICPHPCESSCNRNDLDSPVAIEFVKRFLADVDVAKESPYLPEKKPGKKERVAVIGAGPAGLTAANYLAIEGYAITVFEKLPVAGGMMAVGIPEFRLPRNILQTEIDAIKALGVEIRCNVEIGKDIGFGQLWEQFDAVFVGIGCQKPLELGIPGEDELAGVWDGLTFLRQVHLGRAPAADGKLVVVGGGNTAVDCARVAKRLGYATVSILYRRTREEMPASPWEVEDTIEEEVDVVYLTAPVKIHGEKGRVTGLECVRMKLGEPDGSGRRRPVPVAGSEFMIQADIIVTALGQTTDLSCFPDELKIDISAKGLVTADLQTGSTPLTGLFSGGDAVSGPRTVVEAVAMGKKAAIAIDAYLQGREVKTRGYDWTAIIYQPEERQPVERSAMARLSIAERMASFKEVDLGFDAAQARYEAERCFRICGMQRCN
jgi:NADPH-dependent glutamate synthase beta subunit-like oxidoreductase